MAMNDTTIEWADKRWNPVDGCTEVSPGCDHCYAKAIATRFAGSKAFPHGFVVTLQPERLRMPYTWKKPQRVFVNSMSDLLHKDVPDEFILSVFDTMIETPQHTYMVLTKRPSRLANTTLADMILHRAFLKTGVMTWPKNVLVGVSVESMDYIWRIDTLRKAFSALVAKPTLFISAEPLLEALALDLTGIAWLITGAESGSGARPMQEDWVRSLRDQCATQGVRFFYKQKLVNRKKVGLPMLDGRQWMEYPGEDKEIA
jgi:protein gp37